MQQLLLISCATRPSQLLKYFAPASSIKSY